MKRFSLLLLLNLAVIAVFTALGPAEKTLGVSVRVVYLHGVWVWTALAGFLAAAVAGLVALARRSETLHRLSLALGRTGLFFWISYLPISMWAMQTNWNGLFLAEPRWRMAIIFAAGGLALQIGVVLMENPAWASVGNVLFAVALGLALRTTENVMHPPAPILDSDAARIQLYFGGLLLLVLLFAAQVARYLFRRDQVTG
jgi:hypothetical protein